MGRPAGRHWVAVAIVAVLSAAIVVAAGCGSSREAVPAGEASPAPNAT